MEADEVEADDSCRGEEGENRNRRSEGRAALGAVAHVSDLSDLWSYRNRGVHIEGSLRELDHAKRREISHRGDDHIRMVTKETADS